MRIPESVKIGPYRYRIDMVQRPASQDGGAIWGRWHTGEQLIVIDSTASEEREAVTFLHESLHALDDFARLGLTEEQVTLLAPVLLLFLRENNLLREGES